MGLVGKPSCGKSTFFKAATLAEVEIASYPFTTIKPNHGVGYVKVECIDKEFKVQCQPSHGFCINHFRFVPVDLMDVAGLVPGASEGKGLGNQFLDDLRNAEAFIHIVDSSGLTDENGKPTENYDPCKDIEFLEDELNKWYANILKKVWKTFARQTEIEDKDFAKAVAKQFSGLKVDEYHVKDVLKQGNFSNKAASWTDEEVKIFASMLRKKSKPMIIAANKVDMPQGRENYSKLRAEFPNLVIIPCSADSELALREASKAKLINYILGDNEFEIINNERISENQLKALNYIKENVLDKYDTTGIQEVLNKVVFDLLKYVAVFPGGLNNLKDSFGRTLPDCYLLPESSTALDFAFKLHTDFGKNFIKAIDVKTKKIIGKEHVLKNLDVIEIVTKK